MGLGPKQTPKAGHGEGAIKVRRGGTQVPEVGATNGYVTTTLGVCKRPGRSSAGQPPSLPSQEDLYNYFIYFKCALSCRLNAQVDSWDVQQRVLVLILSCLRPSVHYLPSKLVMFICPNAQVDSWDVQERVLVLPEGLGNGDVVEVVDTWMDRSHPASVLNSDAFSKVRMLGVFLGGGVGGGSGATKGREGRCTAVCPAHVLRLMVYWSFLSPSLSCDTTH